MPHLKTIPKYSSSKKNILHQTIPELLLQSVVDTTTHPCQLVTQCWHGQKSVWISKQTCTYSPLYINEKRFPRRSIHIPVISVIFFLSISWNFHLTVRLYLRRQKKTIKNYPLQKEMAICVWISLTSVSKMQLSFKRLSFMKINRNYLWIFAMVIYLKYLFCFKSKWQELSLGLYCFEKLNTFVRRRDNRIRRSVMVDRNSL